MKLTYEISQIAPYINWVYFFYAWGIHNRPEAEKAKLRQEADEALRQMEGRYHTHALFQLFEAYSEGDDIFLCSPPESGGVRGGLSRIPLLRQQQPGSECLCLADFISPDGDKLGIFATSVDHGLELDFDSDPYQKMLMQLLADRLAEATAERMHEEVRKKYWGYAPNEQLTIAEMLVEKFQGIRPAVGYPSLPDTSLNFVIDELLDMKQVGIRLTESGAMKPHASVSGLMMAHPQARYFNLGKIGEDQLADYARRRGLPVEVCRKFLAANL